MASPAEKPLSKLSMAEFSEYNRLANLMDSFHNHFRAEWNMLYGACSTGKRPAGVTIRQFLRAGEGFCDQVTRHHTIEEQYVFPMLAKRMPAFRNQDVLLKQHEKIHEGLEKLETYFGDCLHSSTDLSMAKLKNIMDSFGKVLWTHLDEEVQQLGAENMRKYWTLEEMRNLGF